jgi:hypothetical protein
MRILVLLRLPFLALAATFTGTVVDLSGVPIAGAVVNTVVETFPTT